MQKLDVMPYFIISSYSKWGTPNLFDLFPREGDRNLKAGLPEGQANIEAWIDFIKYFSERYDNDGIDDMPNLTRSVNYLQLAEEWPSAWVGGNHQQRTETYVETLNYTTIGAKTANPRAKIVIAGLTRGYRFAVFGDGYIDDVDGGLIYGEYYTMEELKQGIPNSGYQLYNMTVRYFINNGSDFFDIISIHAFEEKDTFLDAKYKWLYDRYKEYNVPEKGILLSGGNGPFTNTPECHPRLLSISNAPFSISKYHYTGIISWLDLVKVIIKRRPVIIIFNLLN